MKLFKILKLERVVWFVPVKRKGKKQNGRKGGEHREYNQSYQRADADAAAAAAECWNWGYLIPLWHEEPCWSGVFVFIISFSFHMRTFYSFGFCL
jgi:hypothetical protein